MKQIKEFKIISVVVIIVCMVITNTSGVCLGSEHTMLLRIPLISSDRDTRIAFEEDREKKWQPDLTKNSELTGVYKKLKPHTILTEICEPKNVPFHIYRKDIRTYLLDITKMGYVVWMGESDLKAFTTATYYTSPQKELAKDQIVDYVEALLDFVADISKDKERLLSREAFGYSAYPEGVYIIIEDKKRNQFVTLLQELAKEYAKGLFVLNGKTHIYRQIDVNSELGRKIFILAKYLSNNYGFISNKWGLKGLAQRIFVDENGNIFIGKIKYDSKYGYIRDTNVNYRLLNLAHELGKGIFNIVETRLVVSDEIENIVFKEKDIPLVFERLVSDYSKEELVLCDARKARTSRLLWLVWTGIYDGWFYNTVNVEDVPIDFDFDGILSPYDHFSDIDIDEFTWMVVRWFLEVQTESMDTYHRIEDYDLSVIPEIIAKLSKANIKEMVDRNVPVSLSSYVRDISTNSEIYDFFNGKIKYEGRWLWKAITLMLNKLTGSKLSVEQLKEMIKDSNRGKETVFTQTCYSCL